MRRLFRVLLLLLCAALPASAQYYSSGFGGEIGTGYVANPAAGSYTVIATPGTAQTFPAITVCEAHNVAAVVPLAPQGYQPAGSSSNSVTSSNFSLSAGGIVLVGATANAGGFTVGGTVGGNTVTVVPSTNGQNINAAYVTFGSAQSGINSAMTNGNGGLLISSVALLSNGSTPVVDSCSAGLQQNGSPINVQTPITVTGGSGHVLIAFARNAAGSQIPITFTDASSANGGQGNLWLTLAPNIYYVSQATGSDSNTSTQARSTSTPWKTLPGMANTGLSYSPVAGDIFILKGCDDWPNASFPFTWTATGTAAAHIKISVDQSWYNTSACASAWNRPKFDAGGTAISPPMCTSATPNSNLDIMMYFTGGNYYTDFSWIEEVGYDWTQGENSPCYGLQELNKGIGAHYLNFSNFYVHDWTCTSCAGDAQFWTDQSDGTVNIDHWVIDNTDGDQVAGGNIDAPASYSIWKLVANALRVTAPGVYANNNISDVVSGAPGEHSNAFESLASGQTLYLYNNWIHDCANAGITVTIGNPGETDYLWNNVIGYNCPNGGDPVGGPQSTPGVSVYLWNNTLIAPGGACFGSYGTNQWTGTISLLNNFCLTTVTPNGVSQSQLMSATTFTGYTTLVATGNEVETATAGASQGYSNSSTYSFGPTSRNCNGIPTNCPIGAGGNLNASATGQFAALALDTTLACTEQTINTVVESVCPQRPAIQRPQIGVTPQAWDSGAYQLAPALTVAAGTSRGTIYPDIYGFMGAGNGLDNTFATSISVPLVRMGGDPWSRYNGASDSVCYVSYQTIWQCGVQFTGNGTAYNSVDSVITNYRSDFSGVHILMTIPTIPYVSYQSLTPKCSFPVSVYGSQTSTATVSGISCGNGINGSGNIVDTNPTYNMVANSTTIAGALAGNVLSNAGSGQFYQLDNEPGSWSATHRDAVPCTLDYTNTTSCAGVGTLSSIVTYDETMSDEIYTTDSTAKIFGPSDFGPYGIFNNCSACTGGANPSYSFQMFLKQYSTHDTSLGHRTLYALDEHWQIGNWDGVIADDFNWNRTFWDSNYLETTFGGVPVNPVQLIPTLESGATTYYPGTFVSFSELECSFYSGNDGVDAAVLSDALGIFGYYGVRMAALYPSGCSFNPPPNGVQAGYKMFLNYDGAGHKFGNTAVTSTSSDPNTLAVYPAIRSSDGHLTIIVVNKSPNAITSPLTISGFSPNSSVPAYTFSNSTNGIASGTTTASTIASGYSYPGYGTTLFDLTPSGVSPTPPAPSPPMFTWKGSVNKTVDVTFSGPVTVPLGPDTLTIPSVTQQANVIVTSNIVCTCTTSTSSCACTVK